MSKGYRYHPENIHEESDAQLMDLNITVNEKKENLFLKHHP